MCILEKKCEAAWKFPKTRIAFSQQASDGINDYLCVFPIASCAKN